MSVCRVVTVSSDTHSWYGPLDFSDLMAERRTVGLSHPANPLYCKSKLANALFNVELSKKLQGTGVTTYALHPGVIPTDLSRNWKFPLNWIASIMTPAASVFMKSIEDVSLPLYFRSILNYSIKHLQPGIFICPPCFRGLKQRCTVPWTEL